MNCFLSGVLITLMGVSTESVFCAENAKPFVIPEVREWKGGEGDFMWIEGSKIVVAPENKKELQKVASIFADDLKTMFGKEVKVVTGKPEKGDFFLSLGKGKSAHQEAYELEIGDVVTIKGNEPVGAFWATRTLLQMLEQTDGGKLVKGAMVDYPAYANRGYMLDVARKFFKMETLEDYVKMMAYYKMNTFQVHLNDLALRRFFGKEWDKMYAAFRLECSTYPGLTSKDGHYTKKEFVDFQKMAQDYFVNIIPEIDAPAHSLAYSRYLPEIGSQEYGMDHLDLFNSKTYEFLDGLYEEYLGGENPVFLSKQFHIGTDEYSNKDKKVVEKFRYFTDYYIKKAESYGKQAVIWGALTHAKGETPVKVKDVLMQVWHNPYAQPLEMHELGYDMMTVPDGMLYIVPAAGYYYDYLNMKAIYHKWDPTVYGKEKFEPGDPQLKGGMFAVWNDHYGNGISEKDVAHRVFPAMQVLSAKFWNGNSEKLVSFKEFDSQRILLSEAPGVNMLARVKGKKGVVLKKESVPAQTKTGMLEIGYNYDVSFVLHAEENPKGTLLFKSPNAQVYLKDPEKGQLGFERDGYTFLFDYVVPVGKDVALSIKGDNTKTDLYVDGELKESLAPYEMTPNPKNDKLKMKVVRTLVFPLEETGDFKGSLKNLKVSVVD